MSHCGDLPYLQRKRKMDNEERREMYKETRAPKPVMVLCPEVAEPIWLTEREFKNTKKYYLDSEVFIKGKKVEAIQQTLL
jgi:hypothetical protein